jgi:hypothetical protein
MTPHPPTRSAAPARTWRTAITAIAVAVALAGCGLAEDGSPEALAVDNIPYDLLDPDPPPSTTTPPTAGSTRVTVYFVEQSDEGTRLRPTEREVSDPRSVTDRLQALLDQPPTADEVEAGITTLIPSETSLGTVDQSAESGEVVVELSREFFDLVGQGQRAAFAQITCTATEVAGTTRVRFLLEGEPVPALVADGTSKEGAVSCRQDYLGYTLPEPPAPTTTTTVPEGLEGEADAVTSP